MSASNTHFLNNLFSFRNIIIAIVILLVAFFSFSKYSQLKNESEPVTLNVSASDHTVGKSNAKVEIVEYADLQCPACKAFYPIVEEVVLGAIAKGEDIKYTFKHFPLVNIHANAMLAAIGAEAADRQGKFWEYKKVVFERQEEWASSLDAKSKIESYLPAIGVDVVKWSEDIKDKALEEKVTNSLKEALSLNLNGTPSFIINGLRVNSSNLSSVEKFRSYIDKELSDAAAK